MNFHEIQFPASLSIGSSGGPERKTEIVTLNNGFEERNTSWAHSRRRYDAGLGMRSLDDLADVTAFFEARQGQLIGFRWKDWTDFKSCRPSVTPGLMDQEIGRGDGDTKGFMLSKTYSSGGREYQRPISKPVAGSVHIAVGGVPQIEGTGLSIDYVTGRISFIAPPPDGATITAGFEFDVPVRFDMDRISTSLAGFSAGEIPSVPVVEVRVA